MPYFVSSLKSEIQRDPPGAIFDPPQPTALSSRWCYASVWRNVPNDSGSEALFAGLDAFLARFPLSIRWYLKLKSSSAGTNRP